MIEFLRDLRDVMVKHGVKSLAGGKISYDGDTISCTEFNIELDKTSPIRPYGFIVDLHATTEDAS